MNLLFDMRRVITPTARKEKNESLSERDRIIGDKVDIHSSVTSVRVSHRPHNF